MDHAELVSEIPVVEKMSTQERLKHAKKRRTQQLKRYVQYEKQLEKENNKKKKSAVNSGKKMKKKNGKINFVSNVVLLEAAARNDIEEVRSLLMSGVTPDVTNEDGLTALHQCCIDDCEDMMKLLIEFNANVNARDSELWTPLHAAATCGHVHLCKYLIEKSAELLAVNADGNMPYDICEDEVTLDYIESEMAKRGVTQELIDETRLSTERQMLDDLRYLADSEEDLEFRDRNGATPLHIAAANGYLQVAEFLLDHHVCVDVEDNDSWQPIHAAACWGHPVMLELLVQNGADFEARTRTGETPFDICEDPEMKQRIMEMKDELETNKAHRHSDLRQRRNQNTRSASVRRTSMRDKSKISWKEALEEAKHLRGVPPMDQPAEEDTEAETQLKSKVSEESGFDELDSEPNELRKSQENLPTTNIDDVNIAMLSVDTIARKHSKDRESSSTGQQEQASSHHKTDTKIHKQKHMSSEPKHHRSHDQHAVTNGEREESEIPDERKNSISSIAERKSSTSSSEMRPVLIPTHGNVHVQVPSGTLADLKKHRAQQFQNSLRYRDTRNLQTAEDSSTKDGPLGSNGQVTANNIANNHANSNNNLYYSGEQPIHRFTANSTTEIIGADEGKQRCCSVM